MNYSPPCSMCPATPLLCRRPSKLAPPAPVLCWARAQSLLCRRLQFQRRTTAPLPPAQPICSSRRHLYRARALFTNAGSSSRIRQSPSRRRCCCKYPDRCFLLLAAKPSIGVAATAAAVRRARARSTIAATASSRRALPCLLCFALPSAVPALSISHGLSSLLPALCSVQVKERNSKMKKNRACLQFCTQKR